MQWQQRASALRPSVAALNRVMLLQYTLPSAAHISSVAASSFTSLVSAGLPAINIAYVNGASDAIDSVWVELAEAFESFLHGPDHRDRVSATPAAASLTSQASILHRYVIIYRIAAKESNKSVLRHWFQEGCRIAS